MIDFIKSTQPKAWKRYEAIYNGNAEQSLYRRFNECVNENGLIFTLRRGIKDRGVAFSLAYFAPTSALNPELTDLYNKNILTCTRQFHYSPENNNSIDMVLSINGIPIVALELKNQLKGQTVDNSKYQFMHDRNPKESCFAFNKRFLVYFAVDLYEAWMTTKLDSTNTVFLPFNQGSNGAGEVGGAGNPPGDTGYVTAYLWEKVLQRDMLMRILQRYISLQVKEKTEIKNNAKTKLKTKKIIFPRYHQLDVVEKS
jgi:type I restriction enzyme R subunit